MDGEVPKVIGDIMKGSKVKQPVIVMVWCYGDVGSRFDIGVVDNFEAGTCSVNLFVAPLIDIKFMLTSRVLTMRCRVSGVSTRGKFFGWSFVYMVGND